MNGKIQKVKEWFFGDEIKISDYGKKVPSFRNQIWRHGTLSLVVGSVIFLSSIALFEDRIFSSFPVFYSGIMLGAGGLTIVWGLNFLKVSKGLEAIRDDDEPLERIYGDEE